jgi:beta-lactamase class A
MPLKKKITEYIDQQQRSGSITDVSVYISVLGNDNWININADKEFRPGAMLKIPLLITYLKMAESKPGILEEKYTFSGEDNKATYSAKNIQPGHSYSVKELFHFMIAYADEYAGKELMRHVDKSVYNKIFSDLKIKSPDNNELEYKITTRTYSRFLEILYNAAYLTISASEYATELLADASFKDGIIRNLPKNIPVAHKMGEWSDGKTAELHDCGIVYIDKNPYIITVMTRGTDMPQLSETIGNISMMVFNEMSGETK